MKGGFLARSALAVLFLGVVVGVAQAVRTAAAAGSGQILVDGAYALGDAKLQSLGYVYLTISAPSNDVDALVGASSPAAATVDLMVPTRRDGPVTPPLLRVDGHLPLVLQPRGPHLILKGLDHPLRPGQRIHVILNFRDARPIDVLVDVLSKTPAAGAPRLPHGVKID